MLTWYLGTIGFGYKDWKGAFYPPEIKPGDYLSYYSRSFNTVELDTTFYGIPKAERIQQWAGSVPDGFQFCAKTPRVITHDMGLQGVRGMMDEFLTVMQLLGNHLGVILLQFPPSFTLKAADKLAYFLEELPKGIRYAVELRHRSWYCDQTEGLLKNRNIAWASLEYPKIPMKIYPTADFLYIRWIGQHGSYDRHTHEREDKTSQLVWWNAQIDAVGDRIHQVYGYFNNDYAGFAAGTCNKFKRILGLPVEPVKVEKQPKLF